MFGFKERRWARECEEDRLRKIEDRLTEIETAHNETITDLAHHFGIALAAPERHRNMFLFSAARFEHEGRRVKMESPK